MPQLRVENGEYLIDVEPGQSHRMKGLPARYDKRRECWVMKYSFGSLIMISSTFPDADIPLFVTDVPEDPIEWFLRPYQGEAASRMLDRRGFILEDEQGTGKTITAIGATVELPVLVVCENNTKYQWADAWATWRPDLTVTVVEGTAKERVTALMSGADVTIITWPLVWRHSKLAGYGRVKLSDRELQEKELNRQWGTLIIDEAHKMKDPHAKQTRALWAIARESGYRYALTGTPISRTPDDLWSLLYCVQPDCWPVHSKFLDRYCATAFNPHGGLVVYGLRPEHAAEFHRIHGYYSIRRTLREVEPDLPDEPQVTIRSIEMTKEQDAQYRSLKKDMRIWFDEGLLVPSNAMVQTGRLLQIASAAIDAEGQMVGPSNKVSALLEILEEYEDQAVLVLTKNRALATLCVDRLGSRAVAHHGGVSSGDREIARQRFRNSEVPVLVATYGTISTGVDGLQDVCHVGVRLQRPWDLLTDSQATSRLLRSGQKAGTVQFIDVMSRGTVEQRVLDVLAEKEMNFDEVTRDSERLRALVYEQ